MVEQAELGVCPVCAGLVVDGVCAWASYTTEDYIQAETIYNSPGGDMEGGWVDSVLAHEWQDTQGGM